MRAARLRGSRALEITQEKEPVPQANEVVFRVEHCGVCASNLAPWEGRPWFDYPFPAGAPGHEAGGVITARGAEVKEWEIGQRIAALSYQGYADYDVAKSNAVIALPPELDGVPFPGEPLGCAMNIFRRSGIEADLSVAIIGVGFLGALLVQLAINAGARVVALARRPFALEVAARLGAVPVSLVGENIPHDSIRANSGQPFDVVVEAAGQQETLDLGGELVRERGRLIIAGYHQDGRRSINLQQWNWQGIDVINAHERDPKIYLQGMREAMAAVVEGRLDPVSLITHRFPLEELGQAFAMTAERPEGFMKALIVP